MLFCFCFDAFTFALPPFLTNSCIKNALNKDFDFRFDISVKCCGRSQSKPLVVLDFAKPKLPFGILDLRFNFALSCTDLYLIN